MCDYREEKAPTHPKQTKAQVPITGIWEALPEDSRQRPLAILTAMVMARVATPPSEKEVHHDWQTNSIAIATHGQIG